MANVSPDSDKPGLEEAIATNPVALSPLLLKRTGLLKVEIASWCEQGCAFITGLAQELKVVRPNVFDRRPCAAELLVKQLDALLALGLSRPGSDGSLSTPGFEADLEDLLQSLVDDFLELVQQEIELYISSYVLRVEREEPDGCSEAFDTLKARRDAGARIIACTEFQKVSFRNADAAAGSALPRLFLRDWLATVIVAAIEAPTMGKLAAKEVPAELASAIKDDLSKGVAMFDEFRRDAIKGAEELKPMVEEALKRAETTLEEAMDQQEKAKQQAVDARYHAARRALEALQNKQPDFDPRNDDAREAQARAESEKADAACDAAIKARDALSTARQDFASTIPELVDRTLVLLRVEVLEDVLEANYPPSVRTSPLRADRVAQALDDLKDTLRKLCGGPAIAELVTAYCKLMFKKQRFTVFSKLLSESNGAALQPGLGRAVAERRYAAAQRSRITKTVRRLIEERKRRSSREPSPALLPVPAPAAAPLAEQTKTEEPK
ncbi:MAG: hypothetical protein ABI895_19245 [Deltaproteobacteria bacterium]